MPDTRFASYLRDPQHMPDLPLVSAIIIFLNAERFIREAIESVLEQRYISWELILVDDGSSDRGAAIAEAYVRRFPDKVRYVSHPGGVNRGMSASRNLGIRCSRGHYIGFLDADDVWLPHKLAEQVEILEAHPTAGMTYGRGLIWHSWTGNGSENPDSFVDLGVVPNTLIQRPHLLPLLLENKAQTPMSGNALMRRSAVQRVGGFEESFRAMYEDQVFFAKLELHYDVFVADACWMKYRQHSASCTGTVSASGSYLAERLPFVLSVRGYLEEQSVPEDSAVRQALQSQLRLYRCPRMDVLRSTLRRLMRGAYTHIRADRIWR